MSFEADYQQRFGGDWTEIKLQKISKYLRAYAQIMKNRSFVYAYIDAFAGTGYRTLSKEDSTMEFLLPLNEREVKTFIEGSARIALQIVPRFSKYIFIEKDSERLKELENLKVEFPKLANDISLVQDDANNYLQTICQKNWLKTKRRAVLFLDPFGMQVQWQTIEVIASTQAIDLWILFPLSVAVNRMLTRDAKIPTKWEVRLNQLFGTDSWKAAFYETKTVRTLFGDETRTEKVDNPFETISNYFVERLQTVFPGVATNPLPLYNSRNNPLYLLCFASGNKRGAETAIRIAQDILAR